MKAPQGELEFFTSLNWIVTEGPPTTRRWPLTQSSSFSFLSSRKKVSLVLLGHFGPELEHHCLCISMALSVV